MKTLAIELQRETNFKIFFSANLITGKIVANWTWTADDFSIKSRQRPPHSKQKIDGECMRASACQCSCARWWFFIWYDTNTEADDGRHHRQSQYSNILFYKIIYRRLSRTASHSLARCAHNFLFSHLRCLTEMKTERRKKRESLFVLFIILPPRVIQIRFTYYYVRAGATVRPIHTPKTATTTTKRSLFICVVFDNDEQCCLWISCTWICVTKLYARIYRICALVARSFILRCTVGIAEYVWHTLIVTVTVRAHKNQIELLLFFFISSLSFIYFFLLKEINTRLALRLRIEILSLCQCAYSIGIFTDASKG